MSIERHPAGTPTGGRFAPGSHAEGDIELGDGHRSNTVSLPDIVASKQRTSLPDLSHDAPFSYDVRHDANGPITEVYLANPVTGYTAMWMRRDPAGRWLSAVNDSGGMPFSQGRGPTAKAATRAAFVSRDSGMERYFPGVCLAEPVDLGLTVSTRGVSKWTRDENGETIPWRDHWVRRCLQRHQSGDWGDLDAEDWAENERAATTDGDEMYGGGRIFSAYEMRDPEDAPDATVWVITEADRSATTVLFPSEY